MITSRPEFLLEAGLSIKFPFPCMFFIRPSSCKSERACLRVEDLLEEEMAIHSRILAWEIPWTEEPGGLVHEVAKELEMT